MDLDQLQLFRDIAHTRSISRGAEMNGLTQSAASQAVQEMERRLGVQLLDRSRRPLVVLPAGQLLYDFARDVLRRRQDLLAQLEELKNEPARAVRIAAIYSVGLNQMSRLEEEFRRRMPGVRIEVSYLRPEKVYQAVAEDRVDLGLVSYPASTREVAAIPWKEEPMVVACNPGHRLAGRQKISVTELAGEAFVGFDEDLPISREIERFLREHGVRVQVPLRFDNIQSMKEALRLEPAVSILPLPMLEDDVAEGRLVAVPLVEPLTRPLGVLQRRRKVLTRAARTFLDVLKQAA
ncbi:MAG: LysR family transcriptional regulator [Bryobacteraceae bacterium]|nr:LysR family transcriptional regulator [Bryobacteraceae bacterium]MCX7602548.1 LysR family transcriptional regulator [Bryobacteraceae bacterium]